MAGSNWTCEVAAESKLPHGIAGTQICETIEQATLQELGENGSAATRVAVRVTVESAHKLSAIASVDGRALAAQNVATSDAQLSRRSIDMLARAVAAQVANSLRERPWNGDNQ